MSVRVFCRAGGAAPGERVVLDADESRYLVRVRRRKVGDALELLDGEGGKWSALRDEDDSSHHASVRVLAASSPPAPTRPILLLQALIDAAPLATVLTAATELGVLEVVLVAAARTQSRAPSRDRIDRLLRAAMRQSGRPTPLRVHDLRSLGDALALHADWPAYFAWERLEAEPHALLLPPANGFRLFVGPEGGLHPDEVNLLESKGCTPLSLGPWTLRSETAATAGITRLLWASDGSQTHEPPVPARLTGP